MSIENILKNVPLFRHFPDRFFPELTAKGEIVDLEAGAAACREGDATDCMYVILEGRVRVFMDDGSGNEVDLAQLDQGEIFGELALIDTRPRSATVQCMTPCKLFRMDRPTFMNLIMATGSEALLNKLLTAMTEKVRNISIQFFTKELDRRMLKAQIEIERHRSMAELVAGVAHELNTPLGITNTAVNMIANRVRRTEAADLLGQTQAGRDLMEEILEAADLAQRNIARSAGLVKNFKQISVSQLTDVKETVDLPDLMSGIVDLFKVNARKARMEIVVTNSLEQDSRTWQGYPGYLTQVMMNFLTNIERYAYEPGKGGRVEIHIRSEVPDMDPIFFIRVRDFGRGIPKEDLSKIFDPFYTTGREVGGTGLGLAITRNIVTDALKGHIRVNAAPGKGTAFLISFPADIP